MVCSTVLYMAVSQNWRCPFGGPTIRMTHFGMYSGVFYIFEDVGNYHMIPELRVQVVPKVKSYLDSL